MSLANADKTVNLPEGTNTEEVERLVQEIIEDLEDIHPERERISDPDHIVAKSGPGLRSWG